MEIVAPVEVDGIELYISSNGSISGMSQSALAIFCGVGKRSIFQGNGFGIGEKLSQQNPGDWEAPPALKGFQGKVFCRAIVGNNGANIVASEVCAAFVEYYAFDSKAANDKALYSYRKFASKGIHQWIKEATGAIDTANGDKLLSIMQEVLAEVKDLKQISTKYHSIREKTSTYMPGADQMLDELTLFSLGSKQSETSEELEQNDVDRELLLAPCEDGKISLEGWLSTKGVALTKSRFHKLAIVVADNYRALTKKEPERRKFVIGERTKYNVSVYEPEIFPVLQMCLNKVLT